MLGAYAHLLGPRPDRDESNGESSVDENPSGLEQERIRLLDPVIGDRSDQHFVRLDPEFLSRIGTRRSVTPNHLERDPMDQGPDAPPRAPRDRVPDGFGD